MDSESLYLIFNAVIVLLIGLLVGAPYGKAINKDEDERVIQAWRLAHQALPIGAMLMMIVALILPELNSDKAVKWVISWTLIISNYSFVISLTLAPVFGYRGLSSKGPAKAKVIYIGNMVGAATSLIATIVLLYSVWVTL